MITREFDVIIRLPQNGTQDTDIVLTQHDKDVYKFNVRVLDGLEEIDYSEVTAAKITFLKSDKNVVQGDMTKLADRLTYTLGTNEIACPGRVKVSVQLWGATERLTTGVFAIRVDADLESDSAVQSTSEFPILKTISDSAAQALADYNLAIAGYQKMIQASYIIPKSPVDTFSDIGTTYPLPENGWTTRTLDTGKLYRYNAESGGWEWIDTVTESAYDTILNMILSEQTTPWIENTAAIFSTGTGKDPDGLDVDYNDSVVKGPLSATLYGNTYSNMVQNGDFSDGTTGWRGVGAVLSAANNVLSITGNGGADSIEGRQTVTYTAGHKYYGRVTARVTNAVAISMKVRFAAGYGDIIQPTPVENQWYTLSKVFVAGTGGAFDDYIQTMYESAEIANGKVTEVKEVLVIDLSAHGLESLTVEECDARFPYWWDGVKSTLPVVIRSVNKNLFDGESELGSINTSDGSDQSATDMVRSKNYIKIRPNTQYIISQAIAKNFRVFYYDLNKNYIDTYDGAGTFTTPENAYYVRWRIGLANYGGNVQIEEGDTATDYAEHEFSEAFVPVILHSLPNGVADEFDIETGRYTQKIGVKENVSSGTTINYSDMPTGGQFVAYAADGQTQVGVKGDTLTITAATLNYQLAQPIVTPKPPQTLNGYEKGTVYVYPAFQDTITYNSSLGGLVFDEPIQSIESIKKLDGYIDFTPTIASDGLSATVAELQNGDVVYVVAPYRPEVSTVPTIIHKAPINEKAAINRCVAAGGANTKAIQQINETLAILIVLNT